MWNTLGHQNQKNFLEIALKNKKYAHAYLFCGPEAVGKKTLALEFAQKLMQTNSDSKVNPDLIVVGGEKIKIEEIRSLIHDLSLKPYYYQYKVAIIDNFENITEEAANSILKTLEEPNPSTILILITNNRKAILPTIASRTQLVNFSRVQANEIANKFSKIELAEFGGKIGNLIKSKSNQEFHQQFLDDISKWHEIKKEHKTFRLIQLKELAEKENSELSSMFSNWLDAEQSAFKANPNYYINIKLLLDSIAGIKQNFNKKLVLQKLFLNMV